LIAVAAVISLVLLLLLLLLNRRSLFSLLLLRLRWHLKVPQRVEQITRQISIIPIISFFLVSKDGGEAVNAEMKANLVYFIWQIAAVLRWRRSRNRDGLHLLNWLRLGRRQVDRPLVSPSAFIDHLWFFVSRSWLVEWFDGRHGVFGVEVVDRRIQNRGGNEGGIFLCLSLNLSKLLVKILDFINLLGVLNHHDHPFFVEIVGC
jgi:hypothetical protein